MARLLRFAILACLLAIAIGAMLAAGNLNSRAVQNPSMFIDMDPTGNTYAASPTNCMTVGTIENCLTTSPAEPLNHDHFVDLVIQNVEDLVAWQARLNYIGDQMALSGFNDKPFTDDATEVGFINLPRGAAASTSHRNTLPSSAIPAIPPDGTNTPQTARIGSVYNGADNFPISPDTRPREWPSPPPTHQVHRSPRLPITAHPPAASLPNCSSPSWATRPATRLSS